MDLFESLKSYLIALGAWLSTTIHIADVCLETATQLLVFVAVAVRLFGTDIPAARDRFRRWRALR